MFRSIFDNLTSREKQHDTAAASSIFDARSFPVDLDLPSRLYRPGERKPWCTVHVTDVRGGFGVAPYQVSKWRTLLAKGKVPSDLLQQLEAPLDVEGSAYVLAYAERYSKCAYHRIASRRLGDVQNHALSLRTSHGNGGNAGTGWALDAEHSELLTQRLVSIGQASLGRHLQEQRELHDVPIIVVPHRAWASDRRVDTSAEPWRKIVRPTVDTLGPSVAVIGYNTAAGGGLPVPRSWDERALFDDRGRRLD